MLVMIIGAGDVASGIALRLKRSNFDVVMTDKALPTCIRTTVAFSEAIKNGKQLVEDQWAYLAHDVEEAKAFIKEGIIPVLVDADFKYSSLIKPDVLVDVTRAKVNLGLNIDSAPIVIGVGPGFEAGVDCHAVVESLRGHYLGRVMYFGHAEPPTHIPGLIGGFAGERILRAPDTGIFKSCSKIGTMVKAGDIVGYVNDQPMKCTIDGVVRGLMPDGTPVKKGLKSGDVDPRANIDYCKTVSDKASAIAGGVLEAILHLSCNKR